MSGSVQAWFIVETSSMTHDFSNYGRSLSFFGPTIPYEQKQKRRTTHR
ncbi:hypothetical protein [Brevibacillus daliensis]|nr:hypothetical protein [Brevibacillus daliensis]